MIDGADGERAPRTLDNCCPYNSFNLEKDAVDVYSAISSHGYVSRKFLLKIFFSNIPLGRSLNSSKFEP